MKDCIILTLGFPTQLVVACVSTRALGAGGPRCIGPQVVKISAINGLINTLSVINLKH